jgi:hypothetical protein
MVDLQQELEEIVVSGDKWDNEPVDLSYGLHRPNLRLAGE